MFQELTFEASKSLISRLKAFNQDFVSLKDYMNPPVDNCHQNEASSHVHDPYDS